MTSTGADPNYSPARRMHLTLADRLTISNYRQLWQRRYDLAFGAIFSFGAVAQEGGWLHFVATYAP